MCISLSEDRGANHIWIHKHGLVASYGRDIWFPSQFGRKVRKTTLPSYSSFAPKAMLPSLVGSYLTTITVNTRKYRKRLMPFKPLCLPRNLFAVLVLFNPELLPPFGWGPPVAVTCLIIETSSCVGLLRSSRLTFRESVHLVIRMVYLLFSFVFLCSFFSSCF